MHRIPDHLLSDLVLLFEAARQAGRGQYEPSASVSDCMERLLANGAGDRSPYVTLWKSCRRPLFDTNRTTENHLRWICATAAWRAIVADQGFEASQELLAEMYVKARTPEERHPQRLNEIKWQV